MDRTDHVERGTGTCCDAHARLATRRNQHRVTGAVEARLAHVHEWRGRLLLLTGVGVDGAVRDGKLVTRSLAEAGVHAPEAARHLSPLNDRPGVRRLGPVDQRDLPAGLDGECVEVEV